MLHTARCIYFLSELQEGELTQTKLLLIAIGAVLITITVAAVIGLLIARHLDSKRAGSRSASPTEPDVNE